MKLTREAGAILGKSSIEYLNPEDKVRPKSQSYKGFADAPISFKINGNNL